jgi:DNA repair protein RecO (recombination protein O)
MKSTFTTNVIVLNRKDYGENDLRADVLSLDKGRMMLVARGAKKMKSKLAAHLEPFILADIMVVKGKQWNYAGSAAGRKFYPEIKNDLVKLRYAGAAVHLFLDHLKEAGNDPKDYFRLLEDFLDLLEKENFKNESRYKVLYSIFLLKFMDIYGIAPEVGRCLKCGCSVKRGDNCFNIKEGGILCGRCRSRKKAGEEILTISDNCIKIIRFSLDAEFKKSGKVVIEDEKLAEEIIGLVEKIHNYNLRP